MKQSFFIFSLLLIIILYSPAFSASDRAYSLSNLRAFYPKASAEEKIGRQFYDHLASYEGDNPVVRAYQAVSEAVMAKFVWSPYQKLKYLGTSKAMFQDIFARHPDNPEVRFLRYTVEFSIPRYLKMSEHLAADRAFVARHLLRHPNSGIDKEGFVLMRNFMLNGGHLTPAEKARLSPEVKNKDSGER